MTQIRKCGDEGYQSVYQGQMLSPSYGWTRIVPLYLLAVIPRRYETIRDDQWIIDPPSVCVEKRSTERRATEVAEADDHQSVAALAAICITQLMQMADGYVLVEGTIIDAYADALYLATLGGEVVLPNRAGLARAVESYLTAQIALLPPGSIFPALKQSRPALPERSDAGDQGDAERASA